MLTPLTQTAIAVLDDIAERGLFNRLSGMDVASETLAKLLAKLENGGLIHLKQSSVTGSGLTLTGNPVTSYELSRPYTDITLLQILEAADEHLDCNHPTTEEFYGRYGRAAQRLGVINHMTRLYLAEIKLSEL